MVWGMLVVVVEEVGCLVCCDAGMLAKAGYWTIALMSVCAWRLWVSGRGVVCCDWLRPGAVRWVSKTETDGEAVWVVASCKAAWLREAVGTG